MSTFGTSGFGQMEESFGGRRLSALPYAPPRVGPSSRVGSSVGASFHVRFLPGHR